MSDWSDGISDFVDPSAFNPGLFSSAGISGMDAGAELVIPPTTTAPADTSWLGGLTGSLPASVQSVTDAAKGFFGLSLAANQLSTQNALAKQALAQQQLQAQANTGVAQYQAAAKIAAAQAGAQFATLLSNPMILILLIGGGIMLLKADKSK